MKLGIRLYGTRPSNILEGSSLKSNYGIAFFREVNEPYLRCAEFGPIFEIFCSREEREEELLAGLIAKPPKT
jgi:hypothetical protein